MNINICSKFLPILKIFTVSEKKIGEKKLNFMTVQTAPEFRIPYFYVDRDIRGGEEGMGKLHWKYLVGNIRQKGNCIVKGIKWSWGTKKIIFIFSPAHRFASLQEFNLSHIAIMSQDEQLCSDEIYRQANSTAAMRTCQNSCGESFLLRTVPQTYIQEVFFYEVERFYFQKQNSKSLTGGIKI
jgi:hypothetical protein